VIVALGRISRSGQQNGMLVKLPSSLWECNLKTERTMFGIANIGKIIDNVLAAFEGA